MQSSIVVLRTQSKGADSPSTRTLSVPLACGVVQDAPRIQPPLLDGTLGCCARCACMLPCGDGAVC